MGSVEFDARCLGRIKVWRGIDTLATRMLKRSGKGDRTVIVRGNSQSNLSAQVQVVVSVMSDNEACLSKVRWLPIIISATLV